MGDLGVFAAFVIARLCGNLWSRCLRQDVVRCLGFKRILIVRSDHLRRAVFKPLKSACFSGQFPLVPSLENLRKWAIWVSLRPLSYLRLAGTYGVAVCANMLSGVWALSAYYLLDQIIFAELFSSP